MNKKIITYAIIALVILETICVVTLGVLTIELAIWTIYPLMIGTLLINTFLIIALLKFNNRIIKKIAIIISILYFSLTFFIPTTRRTTFKLVYDNMQNNSTIIYHQWYRKYETQDEYYNLYSIHLKYLDGDIKYEQQYN